MLICCNTETKTISKDTQGVHELLTNFMDYLIEKDSVKFYSLFHEDPIVWIGVFKDASHKSRLQKDSLKKSYFSGSYKKFYRNTSTRNVEEKFYNVDIV